MAERKTDENQLVKAILIGGCEGKTALRLLIETEEFPPSYKTTIGIDFSSISVASEQCPKAILQLWDTASQEKFQSLSAGFYRGMHVGLFCISANNIFIEAEREKLQKLLNEFRKQVAEKASYILIVTKCDEMVEGGATDDNVEKEAAKFARKNILSEVIFTSAKNDSYGIFRNPNLQSKNISVSLASKIYELNLVAKLKLVANVEHDDSPLASTEYFILDDNKSKPSKLNALQRFISYNRWELVIGLGLMLGMGLFFALYLFIPPAGFVVTAAMLGLMNLGLGFVSSVYIAAFAVSILAAALGFAAGFFGTKLGRHVWHTHCNTTELGEAGSRQSVGLATIRRQQLQEEEAADRPWLDCGDFTNPFAKCCGLEAESDEQPGERSNFSLSMHN